MDLKALEATILSYLPFVPTEGQEKAVYHFIEYMSDPSPYAIFVLRGYAGTGKTSLLGAITTAVEAHGGRIELMATTGRAAQVLTSQSGRQASTIHRTIYKASSRGIEEGGHYQVGTHRHASTLFVVDEASMITNNSHEASPFGSGDLLDDLLEYVMHAERGCTILVGDTAQLPPVGSAQSEALNDETLRSRYGLQVYSVELTEVVRQREASGILSIATELRNLLRTYSEAEEGQEIPLTLDLSGYNDVKLIAGEELMDSIEDAYRRYGEDEVLGIAPSNKRALGFNQAIRTRVHYREEELESGERLIVARNNYYYTKRRDHSDFIANGEMLIVRRLYKQYEMFGLRFVDASVYLPERGEELEVRLLLTGLTDEQAQRSYDQRLALYNALVADYELSGQIIDPRRAIRQDPFWGALEVKYGYAVTAHKAQGGQWACVFIDLSLMSYLPTDRNMLRWLYTSITRATEQVYLFNAPRALLPEGW